MNFRKLFFKLKKYWREILTAIFSIVSASITFIYHNSQGIIFSLSILLTVLLIVLTLYFHLREKDFYYVALDNYSDKENWFGSGKFDYSKTNDAYVIADTDAGFIFDKSLLWKDYSFEGEFKILNKCLGVILRATNLSNFVMLQLTKDSIRPHLRANGNWVSFETSVTGLKFEEKIINGNWYKFEFVVEGEDIEITISDYNTVIINKNWKIPRGKVYSPVYEKNDDNRESMTHFMDIIISYDYGAVGFRNGHGERALIKNLLIRSINS